MIKSRHKRLGWIALGLVIIGIAVTLVLKAFQSNLVFFFTPSQVAANEAPQGKPFRMGGLVTAGSVARNDGKSGEGLTVKFAVTDTVKTIPVVFTGILPDLFKEGKGVVTQGRLAADGVFHATEVLAKHDENYMPPEAAEALKKAGAPIDGAMFAGQKNVITQMPEKR